MCVCVYKENIEGGNKHHNPQEATTIHGDSMLNPLFLFFFFILKRRKKKLLEFLPLPTGWLDYVASFCCVMQLLSIKRQHQKKERKKEKNGSLYVASRVQKNFSSASWICINYAPAVAVP